MNIRLYHPDSILENTTSLLSKEHTHYVVNVMRLKRGSNLNFFNKNGEWRSEVIFLDKDRVEVKFLEKIKNENNLSKIELAICLVKKNPMEIILQKATELGVSKIIPIISERTEVKELNHERANRIVIEATEQSNQLVPPEITDVKKLKDFLKTFDETSKLLFADVNSKENLKNEDLKDSKSLCILIGPEGDFSHDELIYAKNANFTPVSFSNKRLRSETAAIYFCTLFSYINKL